MNKHTRGQIGGNALKRKPGVPPDRTALRQCGASATVELSRHWVLKAPERNAKLGSDRPEPKGQYKVTTPLLPADCTTKDAVRAELDRIDSALVALFAERHQYVTRMAELKNDPHEAFVHDRIEAIITRVRERAVALDLDEDQAELIWRTLIDWNVNYEKGVIAARKNRK